MWERRNEERRAKRQTQKYGRLPCWASCNRPPQTECLNSRHVLSHSSGNESPKMKVSAGSVPSRDHEGRICSSPLSLACRGSFSCVLTSSPLRACLPQSPNFPGL